MAGRTSLHQVVLKINPPPRSLHESREIYRSLKKYGEIDMFRNLRHEISTLEMKEDAIVLFRNRTAIDGLLAASPLRISVPPPPPPPILSTGESSAAKAAPSPIESFTVNVSESDYNHESKIIHQLVGHMQSPYAVNQESPPGVSITFNTKTHLAKVSNPSDYKENLLNSTSGGWYGWRMEMKQAGIPNWTDIKPTLESTPTSRDLGAVATRAPTLGWGRSQSSRDPPSQKVTSSKGSAIINPAPLPVDPTLRPHLQSTRTNSAQPRRLAAGGRSFLPKHDSDASSHPIPSTAADEDLAKKSNKSTLSATLNTGSDIQATAGSIDNSSADAGTTRPNISVEEKAEPGSVKPLIENSTHKPNENTRMPEIDKTFERNPASLQGILEQENEKRLQPNVPEKESFSVSERLSGQTQFRPNGDEGVNDLPRRADPRDDAETRNISFGATENVDLEASRPRTQRTTMGLSDESGLDSPIEARIGISRPNDTLTKEVASNASNDTENSGTKKPKAGTEAPSQNWWKLW